MRPSFLLNLRGKYSISGQACKEIRPDFSFFSGSFVPSCSAEGYYGPAFSGKVFRLFLLPSRKLLTYHRMKPLSSRGLSLLNHLQPTAERQLCHGTRAPFLLRFVAFVAQMRQNKDSHSVFIVCVFPLRTKKTPEKPGSLRKVFCLRHQLQ